MMGLVDAALDDGELVAAEPCGEMVVAGQRAQPLRRFDQQFVAGRMAEQVVDRLKAVEIDAQHRDRLDAAAAAARSISASRSAKTARLGRPVRAS